MRSKKSLFGISVLFVLVACISHITSAQDSPELSVLNLKCRETVCFIPVDSIIAQKLIPNIHTLYTDSLGAQILVIAQNCESATMHGIEHAPLQMAHIWIRLVGPKTVTPREKAPVTLPTYYWWDFAGKTTSKDLSEAVTLTAKHLDLTKSIEFTLADKGQLIEKEDNEESVGYIWTSIPRPNSDTVGINHIVYGRIGNKSLRLEDSGIIRFVSRGGQTKFNVDKESVLSIFGSELIGISYDFNMNFRAALYTSINKE